MTRWQPTKAQLAVDIVAAVMAGQPRHEVEAELDHWLGRRRGVLLEPLRSRTIDAIAGGCRSVTLPEHESPVDAPVLEISVS